MAYLYAEKKVLKIMRVEMPSYNKTYYRIDFLDT